MLLNTPSICAMKRELPFDNQINEDFLKVLGSFCAGYYQLYDNVVTMHKETEELNFENLDDCKYFLEQGANSNIRIEDNQTPLIIATRTQNLPLIKLLIGYKANVNLCDTFGKTPIFFAYASKFKRENNEIIHKTLNRNIISYLLENNADPNINVALETPLMMEVKEQNFEMVQFLVKKCNADVNRGVGKKTPFSIALEKKNLEITKFLLENKANPNIYTGSGYKAPLVIAIENKSLEMVNLLLASKARVDVADDQGNTPHFAAIVSGDLKISELLQEYDVPKSTKLLSLIKKIFI